MKAMAKDWLLAGAAALMVTLFFVAIGPFWQIHDDAYYAMLADGYGIVDAPVAELPYMHPMVGVIVGMFRRIGFGYSYAALLYGLIALSLTVICWRFFEDKKRSCLVAALGLMAIAPLLLLPQYTSVSGFLIGGAVLLIANRPRRAGIAMWVLACLLALCSAWLRLEMAVLAVVCLAPIAIFNAHKEGYLDRSFFAHTALAVLIVSTLFWLSTSFFGKTQMSEFYRLNDPMAIFENYGYGKAIELFAIALPNGMTANDLALLNSFVFPDLDLIAPDKMSEMVASVPLQNILRIRYWEGLDYFIKLPASLFFWITAAAVILAFFSRLRIGLLVGSLLFVVANIALTMTGKPFPERVALGIAIAFFLAALLTARTSSAGSSASRALLAGRFFALALLTPVILNIANDRTARLAEAGGLAESLNAIEAEKRVYVFTGALPLRAAWRPFLAPHEVPALVFLGSMYLLPEVAAAEHRTGCGGLLRCLTSGAQLSVIGSEDDLARLKTLIKERTGKSLVVVRQLTYPSFMFYQVTAQ